MIQKINELKKKGGRTDIASALKKAREEMFLPQNGARAGAVKVLFLVSDGKHNEKKNQTITEATATKEAGIEIFTIDVKYNENKAVMEAIASDPDDRHYHDIGKSIRQILADVCRPPCTVSTTTATPTTTMTPTTQTPILLSSTSPTTDTSTTVTTDTTTLTITTTGTSLRCFQFILPILF